MSKKVEAAKRSLAALLLNNSSCAERKDLLFRKLEKEGHKLSDLELALFDHCENRRVSLEQREELKNPPVMVVPGSGYDLTGQAPNAQFPKVRYRFDVVSALPPLREWLKTTMENASAPAPPAKEQDEGKGKISKSRKRRGRRALTETEVKRYEEMIQSWERFSGSKNGDKKDFCANKSFTRQQLNNALAWKRARRNRSKG